MAYVFLGDKCLDCMQLGSPPTQAAGSLTEKDSKYKIRIPLYSKESDIQVILKNIGQHGERCGSITLPIKALA